MHIQKFVMSLSLCALVGCGVTAAEELQASADVSVTLDRSSMTYSIDWPDFTGQTYRVEVSSQTDGRAGDVIAEALHESEFTWTADALDARHYFTITPQNGETMLAAVRLLPLEGGRNFRDLGGYETEDGHRVKWGRIYRSGVMEGLTDADYDYLSSLGIKVICDLRTAGERSDEPTDWRAGQIEYLSFPDPEGTGATGFFSVLYEPDVTPETARKAMADGYSRIAHEQVPAYREMFDRLAAGDIPLAFNCSAGKDRTGIGAALLLTALGVPRETVVADYALSDTYVDYMAEFITDAGASGHEDSPYAFLATLPEEVLEPLMRSDPVYIERALGDIEAEYGSVMAFLAQEVDVTDQEFLAIRAQLLQ
ncbi:tyrosine-protein phosphatase [uncultured Hyphomonas sp.]|uniref:tyrosine-protein phosphatase n=1 Tax=uncultured Hyphomonas sp. TaxID=225298 RepID=UPI0030DB083B|tara:strand:- start:11723 stop:12823 length:1101 start_codon:yes stop_codon:yes gene_type:complete